MKFPEDIKIKIIDSKNGMPLRMGNIIIFVHIYAFEKNNYHLGPYFSNSNGEIYLSKSMLEISVNAELGADLMGHKDIKDSSSQVEIEILSMESVNSLIEGRKLWGITKEEVKLYGSKEDLLKRLETSNNCTIESAKIFVRWDAETSSCVIYEIRTTTNHKEVIK